MQDANTSIYHYPTELFELLVETIPKLCRSKQSVIDFFKSSGIQMTLISDLIDRVNFNRDAIYKHEIVREVLNRINQQTDQYLRQRREILKRVVEIEDFSACWPEDQNAAYGLVAKIRVLINVKDSFTRMQQEKDKELEKHRLEQQKLIEDKNKKQQEIAKIKDNFFSLFSPQNPHERGKLLENVLNSLFNVYGILVLESFTVTGVDNEGIVEQIDGAIQLNGNIYLVEMKWWKSPIGQKEVSAFIGGKLFLRGQDARGLFISYSGYTDAAVTCCREAKIRGATVLLSTLEEFVFLLDREMELSDFLLKKVEAAVTHKNPFHKPLNGI